MAYGDIDAGMTKAEKQHLAELEATCEEQSGHISKLGKQIAELEDEKGLLVEQGAYTCRVYLKRAETAEAERDKLRESKDICPVCMTWSWAPCDEGDEGAEQRGEEWALCQCCNDSRIAVLWKGRAEELQEKCDAAFTGLLGASRGECVAWGRKDRQPEIDKLRDYAGHTPGCPGMDWQRHPERGCSCGWVQTEAALGEGGGG